MPDIGAGGEGNVIEQLAVEITADTAPFIQQIEDAYVRAGELAKEHGDAVAKESTKAVGLTDELVRSTKEFVEAQGATFTPEMEAKLRAYIAAVERLRETNESTADGVQELEQAFGGLEDAAAKAGEVQRAEEMETRLGPVTADVAEIAKGAQTATEGVEKLTDALDEMEAIAERAVPATQAQIDEEFFRAGENLVLTMGDLNVTAEEGARIMEGTAQAWGLTRDQLLGAASAYMEVTAQIEAANAAAGATPSQGFFGDLLSQVQAGRQAQGRPMGIMETDALIKKWGSLVAAGERTGASIEQVRTEAEGLAQAAMGAAQGVNTLQGGLAGVIQRGFSAGGIIKMLGTRLLGVLGPAVLLFKAIQGIAKILKEAQQAAMAYDTSLYHLEVSVRAAQRTMGDSAGSVEQWMQAAEDIAAKYGIQTVAAVNEIAASVRRMTLQFDLSAEQAIALTDAGVALATAFGDSPSGVAQALAMFVSTGQNAEGLRQFGFDVSNVGLQAETTREGLAGLYSDLRNDQQIQVRYNLIMEQSTQMMEDAGAATTTLQGRQALYAAATQQHLAAIGQAISPLSTLWRGFVQIVKELSLILVERLIKGLLASFIVFTSAMVGAARVVLDQLKMIRDEGRLMTEEEVSASYGAGFWIMFEGMTGIIRNLTSGIAGLGDEERAAAEAAEAMAENMAASFLMLKAKFAELADRIKNILREIDEAYAQDVLEVNDDMLRERQKKTEDYAREEERDLQNHLLKMRRMEEDYLLELEDAVRARDARQVLLIMRRHRIDERRANEDADIRRRERQQDFQQELQDMAEQANRRLRELELEWQDRRQRALEEHEAYALQLIEQWIRENGITAEGLQQLHDMLLAAFGPGGWEVALFDQAARLVEKLADRMAKGMTKMVGDMAKAMQGAVSIVQQTLAWMASERVGMGQPTSTVWGAPTWGNVPSNPYLSTYQGGGDFVATGPRTIRVGEGRPEAVSIRPFSGGGAAAGGQGGGGRGKMEIDLNVKADPRLIVEATEAAMSEVADVFINITRVSREGRP